MKTIYAFALTLGLVGCLFAADAPGHVPPPPTGLTAKSGANSEVALAWESSPDATGYRVYRSTTQNDINAEEAAATVPGTSFTATRLKNNTTYYFKVKAVGPNGMSGFSQEVAATTEITHQLLPNGVYTLAPRNAPGLRLQGDDPDRMTLGGESAPALAQQWTLTFLDRVTCQLSSVSSRTPAKEKWMLTPVSDGYRLIPVRDPRLALTATGTTDGAGVSAIAANGSNAQLWNILPVSESAPDPGTAYVPKGYKLVFSDEFDGASIDLSKWETLAPFSQPHLNDEIECYQPEAVTLEHGMCVLSAGEMATTCGGKHTWQSGAITSKSTRTQGYYEARIMIPQGQGLWPAFWLTSSKRWPPEWDIMEIPHAGGTLYQFMHPTKGTKIEWVDGAEGNDSTYTAAEGMPNPYSGFVIYGCESTPQGIKLWINGKLTAQWAVSADTTDPMWVSVNLAVGGKWPGAPDATTPRPARMYIDYVRVYQ